MIKNSQKNTDTLNNYIDTLEQKLQEQENMFKKVFIAGFNSREKESQRAWIKYAKEESDYQFDYL